MKYIGALGVIVLLSVFAWPMAEARRTVNPLSVGKPYCHYDTNEQHLVTATKNAPQGQHFYHIYTNQRINYEICNIANGHSMKIEFQRLHKISDVLVQHLALGKDMSTINVTVWRGNDTFECKLSGDEPLISKPFSFHRFACFENGEYQPAGIYINGLEIKSLEMIPVDLSNLARRGYFGWLLLKRMTTMDNEEPGRCKAPVLIPGQKMLTPFKNEYQAGEIVKFACEDGLATQPAEYSQTCLISGHWSPRELPLCQPSTNAAQWYGTIPRFRKPRVWSGMENVSLVASFNRDLYNVSKVDFGLTTSFEKDEMKRLFDNNIVYQLMNANGDIIYEHRMKQVNTTEKTSITTTFPETVPHCSMCAVIVTFPKYNWDEMIVYRLNVYASAGLITIEHPSCPPIEPYSGMPSQFSNYELVMNGSINELLLKSPCRYGYTLIGDASDINQCKSSRWIGKGFPKCERVVRRTNPPQVEHASWTYVYNDSFDAVVYTCKEGYKPTLSGNARYNVNDDTWADVPECELSQTDLVQAASIFGSSRSLAIGSIVGGVVLACVVVAAVVVTGMYLRKNVPMV